MDAGFQLEGDFRRFMAGEAGFFIALTLFHGFHTEGPRELAVWEFWDRRLRISTPSPEAAF